MKNKKAYLMWGLSIFAIVGIIAVLFVLYFMVGNWNSVHSESWVSSPNANSEQLNKITSDCEQLLSQLSQNYKCNPDACKLQTFGSSYITVLKCGRLYVP